MYIALMFEWDEEYKMWVVDSILAIISNDDVDGALATKNQKAGVVDESSGDSDSDSDSDSDAKASDDKDQK